ncbi:MAG: PAS domain-containing protein [Deltaproteobacteria bacterium]|nr:PAS domain-containing protein [Deltaproteobacteria bacterium]
MKEFQTKEALPCINDDILEAIFTNIHFLVAYLDRDLNFLKVNKAYADMSGKSPEFFIGKNHFQLYPHKEKQDIFQRVVETGKPYHAFAKPFVYRDQADPGVTYWDWSLLPIKGPQDTVTSLILTLVDVTERKEAEERMNVYIKELERSNRELEEFAYVASHDLQEPLRKIQTFGELLKSQLTDALPPDAEDSLERMVRAATRMRTLIESLLTYSRITTKARPFQRVDLTAITKDALSNLDAVITQKNARIEVNALPGIEADPHQMLQLMQNLISNSLKFQKKETIPVIRIWAPTPFTSGADDAKAPSHNTLCEIRVQDNGIGFRETHLDRIFIAFQRLHGRSAYDGVGIGLAICRKIVDRHGGNITAESTPDKGSTFIVRLPFRQNRE